ncbi:MAG: hypothetical protein DRR08_10215 [Candidatus Parabeggiatoa sp. nov. 2]|nr:MAG: hypothetical protein B6247_25345 [Beggiatoa sp. 4572_84]RKZ60890.1 MAG: hypothetical protein DRR08_10215 [Gammaproteobacteria bacterium]
MKIETPSEEIYDVVFNKRSNLWENYDDSRERVTELNRLSKNVALSGHADSISSLSTETNNIPSELTQTVVELQNELNNITNAQRQIRQIQSKIESIKKTAKTIIITLVIVGIIGAMILFHVVKNNPSINTWFEKQNGSPSVEVGESVKPGEIVPKPTGIEEQSKPVEQAIFTLTVRSNVRDDTVFINGKNYGSTRLNVKLPAGVYTVRVEKVGYTPEEKQIDLQSALTERFTLQRIR